MAMVWVRPTRSQSRPARYEKALTWPTPQNKNDRAYAGHSARSPLLYPNRYQRNSDEKWALRINDIFSLYTQKKGVENTLINRLPHHCHLPQLLRRGRPHHQQTSLSLQPLCHREPGAELVAQFITSTHTPYIVGPSPKSATISTSQS